MEWILLLVINLGIHSFNACNQPTNNSSIEIHLSIYPSIHPFSHSAIHHFIRSIDNRMTTCMTLSWNPPQRPETTITTTGKPKKRHHIGRSYLTITTTTSFSLLQLLPLSFLFSGLVFFTENPNNQPQCSFSSLMMTDKRAYAQSSIIHTWPQFNSGGLSYLPNSSFSTTEFITPLVLAKGKA